MKTQHVAILMALALVVPTASCSRCNKSKGGGGGGSASGSGTSGGGDGTASAARPSTIDREVKLDWPGKVVRASGATKAKAGDTCNIETRFASDGARTLLSQVSMTCGGQKIYQGGSGAGLNCRVNESPLSFLPRRAPAAVPMRPPRHWIPRSSRQRLVLPQR